MSSQSPAVATLAKRLRYQSRACEAVGSPLYADLLNRAAADVEVGGATWEVLEGHENDPPPSALALRLMGSVHRLALDGSAPQLAALYANPEGDRDATFSAFIETLRAHAGKLRELIDHGVQTNEVGRCSALLPGFLLVAAHAGMPLRLLELGASGGLNLRFDRYRYDSPGLDWGSADSPVQLRPSVVGSLRGDGVEVAERLGCDLVPLDPAGEDDKLTLLSFLWPDQPQRIERLRAALSIAGEVPATVERSGAAAWLEEKLAAPNPGVATVVFHSIFIQYPSDEERVALIARIAEAGQRASAEAPLAWLRMEPGGEATEVRLTSWPGGEERLVARAGYHGDPIELL